LAACHSDQATGVANTTSGPATFQVTAAAVSAAAASTNRLVRTLATVVRRSASAASQRSSERTTNSPWDLTDFGGPIVKGGTSRNLYVNCTASAAGCWGTGSSSPATFLRDLNQSSMIQIANQYLGEDVTGKFSLQELSTSTTFANNTASLNDVYAILYAASSFTKASGYNNVYHVFLPQGTDMCITPGECYSPDNPSTFFFCAFHGSVDFGPHWHVLYTVEPYQAVGGCVLPAQTRVIDATASTLSHEFFETITDPDLDAWFNSLTGNEVADLCVGFNKGEQVSRNVYAIQEEYSNTLHACTDGAY
jgi:hypothetical protein